MPNLIAMRRTADICRASRDATQQDTPKPAIPVARRNDLRIGAPLHTRQGPEVGGLVARRDQPSSEVTRALPPFGADGESTPITVLAMPIRVLCAPPADNAAEIIDPLAERLGSASQSCRLAAGPAERAGGPGAPAVREAGRTGSPDECTMRACGSAAPGPAASAGLTRFAPSAIASRQRTAG
jgi:hypothetical protein